MAFCPSPSCWAASTWQGSGQEEVALAIYTCMYRTVHIDVYDLIKNEIILKVIILITIILTIFIKHVDDNNYQNNHIVAFIHLLPKVSTSWGKAQGLESRRAPNLLCTPKLQFSVSHCGFRRMQHCPRGRAGDINSLDFANLQIIPQASEWLEFCASRVGMGSRNSHVSRRCCCSWCLQGPSRLAAQRLQKALVVLKNLRLHGVLLGVCGMPWVLILREPLLRCLVSWGHDRAAQLKCTRRALHTASAR